ncbi:MAG: DUF4450 domain-containing protein [Ferruginibacter sp.]
MRTLIIILTVFGCYRNTVAQITDTTKWWHGKERVLRYHPEGKDFVITNGNRRFTRALYGTNTAFRVEAGDLPEFALYMPGMGGNFKFGLLNNDSSKWLINAKKITARYRAGAMLYEIEDAMLGKGKLYITVLAMADAEGMIVKARFENVSSTAELIWVFGGASGKKFSRDGDMGPDPESSFYLKPEYCSDNHYTVTRNSFDLAYGSGLVAEWDPYVNKNLAADTVKAVKIGKEQRLSGIVPPFSQIHISDAARHDSPGKLYLSQRSATPVVTGKLKANNNEDYYFAIQKPGTDKPFIYENLPAAFDAAEAARKKIADRIKVVTPDAYINTIGGALSIAADAIWESPSYMHGSIGWRMRLNGWRGPYVADVLGWHDRAKSHFKSYALSQVTSPASGPVVADTVLHLARSLEKMGTSVFSSGYISRNPGGDLRPHHYDMNLVFIDALLRHFYWTGDLSFAKKMWPVITRHLAWEKRNFDSDDDGLYDAYAAIWASDALEYSGGSVTHSSAYNYKANKDAAIIAKLIGENAAPFEAAAAKILKAINNTLWMTSKGSYAEYKDLLGNHLLHPNAAVWTIYHSLDSEIPDIFQAYQAMRYIDENIPHIPVRAKGLEEGYYTISTSNWMPYDWSLNNVATAEVMHTALANWQAGINDKGFGLFKSELLSTMYLGGSAGNIGQISYYDASRGEAYRDFADPVAMTARTLIEGLFGILPNALNNELIIKPGFPASWNTASLETPDIKFDFRRTNNTDLYTITPFFEKLLQLRLLVKVNGSSIKKITVNGKIAAWKNADSTVGMPMITINCLPAKQYNIKIIWKGPKPAAIQLNKFYARGTGIKIQLANSVIKEWYDPQGIFQKTKITGNQLQAIIAGETGNKTAFVKVNQGVFTSWQPLNLNIKEAIEIIAAPSQSRNDLQLRISNNTNNAKAGMMMMNPGKHAYTRLITIAPYQQYIVEHVPGQNIIPGTNDISFTWKNAAGNKYIAKQTIVNWNVDDKKDSSRAIDLGYFFNDKVSNIFKNQYLSPRPKVATLQLPTQGIGDWTHPLKTAEINDSGLRKLAGVNNRIVLPQGIPFATPSDTLQSNIVFTSQWDNYPKAITVSLAGKASHAYLLMAGSTNPMQTRFTNAIVIFSYKDGSNDSLLLKNPETWWPIEQDYYDDGYAFTINAVRPVRIHLKTGKIVSDYDNSIYGYNGKMIDGGAATVFDKPLDVTKELKSITLETIANDVVVGLMSITLIR